MYVMAGSVHTILLLLWKLAYCVSGSKVGMLLISVFKYPK